MWAYEKKLQYPVKIKNPNPAYAKIIISQLGGPDGELGAALRYLNQRYTMPYGDIIGILTDVGREAMRKNVVKTRFRINENGLDINCSFFRQDQRKTGVFLSRSDVRIQKRESWSGFH